MTRAILVTASLVLVSGCTTLKIDAGGDNTIEHKASDSAQSLVDRACSRAGGSGGKVVATVNKDASLPAGTGTQVTTFRCID